MVKNKRLPPQASSAYLGTRRKFGKFIALFRNQRVPGILPICICPEYKPHGKFGWKVFQTVDGNINFTP